MQLGNPAACVDLLIKTQRVPEAAIFARTYAPNKVPEAVTAWRGELKSKKRDKLAAAIADPTETPDLFEEGWKDSTTHDSTPEQTHPPLPLGKLSLDYLSPGLSLTRMPESSISTMTATTTDIDEDEFVDA